MRMGRHDSPCGARSATTCGAGIAILRTLPANPAHAGLSGGRQGAAAGAISPRSKALKVTPPICSSSDVGYCVG